MISHYAQCLITVRYSEPIGKPDKVGGIEPCDGLAAHPGGVHCSDSRFMLQKPELNVGTEPDKKRTEFMGFFMFSVANRRTNHTNLGFFFHSPLFHFFHFAHQVILSFR